ncbi:MAG: hypothetical protein JW860_07615 [Sedimentisphaerales bacterium]|nr:hypothetical protein [Sedimentisphaerales bacterium]
MKEGKRKKVIKNGRRRTKLNLFEESGLPVSLYDWKEKLPELLLIVGLLENHSAKEVVEIFRNIGNLMRKRVEKEQVLGFGGGVSELGELLEKEDKAVRTTIKEEVGKIFCGINLSLLKVLDVPGKKVICEMLGGLERPKKNDLMMIMRATGVALHGQSGRATRTKLVQLMLCDPDCRRCHIDFDKLGKLVTGRDDDVLKEQGCASVRSTWGCMQGCKDERITPWVKSFWGFGLDIPCFGDTGRKGRDRIRLSREQRRLIDKIDRLWKTIVKSQPKHDLLCQGDVVLGLTCRVWRFMHHIVEASAAGNGEMAEVAARCQWDSTITLEWLIKRNAPELFSIFRMYSAGKAKATLEKLRANNDAYGSQELVNRLKNTLEGEIQEDIGIWEQLINEERGGWAKEGTYQMAEDLSKLTEYELYFRRLSDIVHGTWRALERYHLQKCLNPLHGGHYMGWTGATHDAGITVIHFGINMAVRVIKVVIDYMGPAADPKWKKRIDKIEQETNQLIIEEMRILRQ